MTNGKNGRKDSEAKRRQTQSSCCHASGHGRASIARRPSIGVPPRFWLRRPNATTRLQFRATWDGARERALSANRPVSVQRSSSQTGRSAGRAGTRSRPGAGCKPARGHRTRPVLRPAGRSTSDWARFESICNLNRDKCQQYGDSKFMRGRQRFCGHFRTSALSAAQTGECREGPHQWRPTNLSIHRPCPRPAATPMSWKHARPRVRSTLPASSA